MEPWGNSGAGATATWRRRVRVDVQPAGRFAAQWRDSGHMALAEPPVSLIELAAEALRSQGLQPDGALFLVRHRAGDRGLPALPETTTVGFAIDLSESRRAVDGGLLLFADDGGRVTGWRAEAGAVTLWSGDDPELTELAPGAPERLTLIGRAKPL